MNNDDISRLKALAEVASNGNWSACEYADGSALIETDIEIENPAENRSPYFIISSSEWGYAKNEDIEYIVTAQPKAILALLARLEEVEALAAQRDAEYHEANDDRAEYASRIAELESKLAAPPSPSATIGSDEFNDLPYSYVMAQQDGDSYSRQEKADIIAFIDAHVTARLAAAGMVDKPQWISMADKMPPKGESVLIFYPQDVAEPYRIDMWDEWHEDHIGMGGPTVCVGEGFMSYGDDDIEYWMPLPDAPAMSQDQKGGA